MKRTALTLFLVAALVGPALAQNPPDAPPTIIRGAVEKLDGRKLTVKTREGPSATVTLAPDVTVSTLVKEAIGDIKPGDYVASTGVRGTDGKLHAVEVRIFPENLRGVREGQFPGSLRPDSTMTNATVTGVASATGGRTLKVDFDGTKSEYVVGPETPVFGYGPGDASLLKPGATVFIIAQKQPDGGLMASAVTAEKDGVKPPM